MPAELEAQLARFAEALDEALPAISVDEVMGLGTVEIDLDALAPTIELRPIAAEPGARRRPGLRIALGAAAAAVLAVAAVGASLRIADRREADVPVETEPTAAPTGAVSPEPTVAPATPADTFVGVWRPADPDDVSTMEIFIFGTNHFSLALRGEVAAAACGGGVPELVGTTESATSTSLVAEMTCQDDTGVSIDENPMSVALDFDTATGDIVDSNGVVWQRQVEPVRTPVWPQSTIEEVRVAQDRADAGDPDATWQLDPNLVDPSVAGEPGGKIVDRFLREVLGWDAYLRVSSEPDGPDGTFVDLNDRLYLRCEPGRTNPLYPPGPSPQLGEECAPTIDDLHYETVSVDLTQPVRKGPDGIWVVAQWNPAAPFEQTDPAVVEAAARAGLDAFLATRVAGQGAERLVQLVGDVEDVPLLYATSAGAPYERYEIEPAEPPRWPDANHWAFQARLFADGDATVIEQEFVWSDGQVAMWDDATIENGQPLVVASYTSPDGEVTISPPSTWDVWLPGAGDDGLDPVWFGMAKPNTADWPPLGSQSIGLVDPVAYDWWCGERTLPTGAAAIAQAVAADPNFETTDLVPARLGGLDALTLDVTLAPGGAPCPRGEIIIARWIHELRPGLRQRLYLVDLPDGMPVQTLAITLTAPEERFEEYIAETASIIESIELNPSES